ncbi:MAG: protein kinase [Chloroflexi bacterium]|nr:protein kinase [Chloroflexota bacterium]
MTDIFGKKLGEYILLEQLGEGGMAKVYNALDSRVERNVAIKVILPSKRTSNVFLQQFEREAKVLANLMHTNIVKVLNYGIQDGQPYLVMEYVSGGTLKEAMNQKIPWQTAAAILAPIARALDYVHRQQIVHRDVKPSNILIQDDFRPMLSDFGILKMFEGKNEKVDSAIGAGVGTPEYMPPEQGLGKDVDFRADIYSLGLVFYEMITGQKPYTADTPMAIIVKHVTDDLPLPTHIDKNIPKFVERVILRAVQKEPQNRYLSMGHFADALELISLGDKASPQKITRISREKEKRQRSFSIYSLSILLVLLALGTSLITYNFIKTTQQAVAPFSAPILQTEKTPEPNPSPGIPPTQAAASASLPTAIPAAGSASGITLMGTPISGRQNPQFKEIARWGIGGVNVARWSPDGKRIALGATSGIFLYDFQSKELIRFIDTGFNVLEMTFNPAGDEIIAGSPTGLVYAWNTSSGSLIREYPYKRPATETISDNLEVTAITFSSNGKNIAIGYKNGAINYFPADQNTALMSVVNYPLIEDLAISADNRFIYVSNGDRDIYIWDIQTGKKDASRLSNPTPINNLSISNDRQMLLAGGVGSSVYLWDLSENAQVNSFPNPGNHIADFDFSADNRFVTIGLASGIINVFETPSLEEHSITLVPMLTFPAFNDPILGITFSPEEPLIASVNHQEGLKVWNAQNGQKLDSPGKSMRSIDEIHLSQDGLWLATAHQDGLLRVWNVNAGIEAYPPFEGSLSRGAPFSPDNRYLAYIYSPGKFKEDLVRILELETGNIVAELPGYKPKAFIQFTEDTKLMIVGDAYSANFWDVSTWELLDTHGGPTAGCGQYTTPQNRLIAIISNAGLLFPQYDEKVELMCASKPRGALHMYYFYEQHKMLLVQSDGGLWVWGFNPVELSRKESSDTPYPLSREIFLDGDQTSGWYAYKDLPQGTLHIENINGSNGEIIDQQNDYQYRVSLLPGQNLMALGSRFGSIHIWTMP